MGKGAPALTPLESTQLETSPEELHCGRDMLRQENQRPGTLSGLNEKTWICDGSVDDLLGWRLCASLR